MSDLLINSGPAVKATGGGRFAGYLVTWGNEATKDADGEWFTPDTDFDTEFPARTSVYWHHGQDPAVGRQRLAHATMDRDDFGVKVEGSLDLKNAKQAAIYRRVEAGEVGLSSGSLGHVTVPPRESPGGAILQWPGIGHDCSLTPIPSDRRNVAHAVKSVPLPPVEELPAGPGEKRSLAEATERITEALEILVGDYRTHAVKAGRKLSAARRERLTHVRDLIDEMLSETEPREEEPHEEGAPAPVTGEGAQVRAAPSPLPDVHDLFAAILSREDSGLNAIGAL